MNFCPKCSYLFDIKASNNDNDNRIILSKINDVFIKIENNENLSNYKVIFSKEELLKNKKYNNLKDEQKEDLEKIFNNKTLIGAEFECNNCGFIKPINETILLYQILSNETICEDKTNNIEENKFITNNPLLPHTHNYTCKNPKCITHEKEELKDCIFIHDTNTYKLIYICCICYYKWNNI
jgi:hypothetical protein